MKTTNLTYGNDFEVVSYSQNVKKGVAKVTFKGIGNYGGEKTVTFKITERNLADEGIWWKDFMDKLFN